MHPLLSFLLDVFIPLLQPEIVLAPGFLFLAMALRGRFPIGSAICATVSACKMGLYAFSGLSTLFFFYGDDFLLAWQQEPKGINAVLGRCAVATLVIVLDLRLLVAAIRDVRARTLSSPNAP